MKFLTIIPAYGRDYKSKKAVLEDWKAGKDFQLAETMQYCSRRDFATMTGIVIMARYRKLTQIQEIERF